MTQFLYNFPKIIKQLEIEGHQNLPEKKGDIAVWLEDSYNNPCHFWQELFNYFSSRYYPPAKSYPFEGYDFYHDMVIRNLNKKQIAFRWYEKGWQAVSYDDLHMLSCQKVREWLSHGITPKQTICMVLPIGLKYLVSLVSALRLGIGFSYLPPYGDMFLAKRIKLLAPDFIVTEDIYRLLLPGLEKVILPDAPGEIEAEYRYDSHTYMPCDSIGMFFSPLSATPEIPKKLTCDNAYLKAMRDGVLVFNLLPGTHWLCPGSHLLQYHPSVLISTLLSGATYMHMTLDDIEENPLLLQQYTGLTMDISPALRNILLKKEEKLGQRCRHWFKNPLETLEWPIWQHFIKEAELENTYMSNIVMDSASGGSLLFSLKRKEYINLNVLPSPGATWNLIDVNRSGQEAPGNIGIYGLKQGDTDIEPPESSIIMSRLQEEWVYLGTIEPTRAGRSYPKDEVMEVIYGLPFIHGSSILAIPTGGEMNLYSFILLIFTGPVHEDEISTQKKKWIDDINQRIAFHLGNEFLPDRIEFYPFYCREKEGTVDHEWCLSQYITGGLYRKTHNEIYKLITQIRSIVLFGDQNI